MFGYIASTVHYDKLKKESEESNKSCDLFWAQFFKSETEKTVLTEEQKKAVRECRMGNHFK